MLRPDMLAPSSPRPDDERAGPLRAGLRGIVDTMREDLDTIVARDPSVHSFAEALTHSTLPAIWLHRIAHRLYLARRRVAARMLSNLARILTGVDIHPGATMGRRLFIDHGTGVVIGETAIVGDDVTIYHQVTLGAVGWWRDIGRPPGARRHPRVGARCTFGASAHVLGPVTIGDDVLIGANSLVVTDIADGSKVLAAVGKIQPDGTAVPDMVSPTRNMNGRPE